MSTQSQPHHAWIEVSLKDLVQNAQMIQERNPRSRLLPMVKANAYGLGAVRVARALETLSPWGYGVATVEEGEELRHAGIELPIIAFTPALETKLGLFREHAIRPVLDDPRVMRDWGTQPFHLEIDTGMGRGGIPWHERARVTEAFARRPEGVFTHLHSADTSPETVAIQIERFHGLLRDASLAEDTLVHVANSAGAFRPGSENDLVRPGIFLYGGGIGAGQPEPAAVATVRARVVSVRTVRAGETVSYGGEWSADRDTTVATLGIGYEDGVRRSIQGRGMVMLGGTRVPVVGRVTMDMTMVAVPSNTPVAAGDVATIFGPCDGGGIGLDEFAQWAGTISYEVLTGLGNRLPRVYV